MWVLHSAHCRFCLFLCSALKTLLSAAEGRHEEKAEPSFPNCSAGGRAQRLHGLVAWL